jgi:hypothetical protein
MGMNFLLIIFPDDVNYLYWLHGHPFQNKQGKSFVENLARDVDK